MQSGSENCFFVVKRTQIKKAAEIFMEILEIFFDKTSNSEMTSFSM